MPTSVALTPYFESYTKQLVSSGRYNNVSEVIRDSLRLHEEKAKQEAAKLKALRDAVKLGTDALATGEYELVRSRDELKTYVQSLSKRASERVIQDKKATGIQRQSA
jgi:antitoxin ParD1/3/4